MIMNLITKLGLQLFADAGTLVNATGNYVNASTGTTTAFDATHTLAPELKTFYDTELLENARAEMFYAQFGKKQALPKNHGGTVEWRKWNTFEKAGKLTEGVIPTGQKFGVTKLEGSINQYGTYTSITDRLELRAYDDVILGATEEMGASAAETQEKLIRDALLTNTNVLYCDNLSAAGAYISTPTSCAEMGAGGGASAADGYAYLTPDMIAKAVTKMKKDRVPTINGKYYAVIHPSVAYDLRKSTEWIEAHKYAQPDEIYNGEIGELHGVRFIETTEAKVFNGEGCPVKTAADESNGTPAEYYSVYATLFLGKDAYGMIDPEGGNMEMIIKDKGQVGGPLNQFSTLGYKFSSAAKILYQDRMVRVESCGAYSAEDEAN